MKKTQALTPPEVLPIAPRCIAVLGDLILDKYTFGDISRISPEAPVPVLEVQREEWRLGGAGNVLLNLADLGMNCLAFGRVGCGNNGKMVRRLIGKKKISGRLLIENADVPTITKDRIIAKNQQVVRLDREKIVPLNSSEEKKILAAFRKEMHRMDGVILSDYGKGFLTETLVREVIELARRQKVPVIVDPKGRNFKKYRGATVITPNLAEARGASTEENLDAIARQLIRVAQLQFILITTGKDGMHYYRRGGPAAGQHFPVHVQEVIDVTGAGDTVVAVAASCLANRLAHDHMCRLCNLAAGYVVGHFGATTISMAQLNELEIRSKNEVL